MVLLSYGEFRVAERALQAVCMGLVLMEERFGLKIKSGIASVMATERSDYREKE